MPAIVELRQGPRGTESPVLLGGAEKFLFRLLELTVTFQNRGLLQLFLDSDGMQSKLRTWWEGRGLTHC